MSDSVRLGFNARISFPDGCAADALRDGIELFRVAEQLGFETGWVYQRHFDNYLASPMTFLAAVGEHTDRIGLGTAIIGMRYEDPVLLAEAAGTSDLLSGGRIQLGMGAGVGGYDAVFGQEPSDGREQARSRLAGFLRAIGDEPVGEVGPGATTPEGTPLRVRPHSPVTRAFTMSPVHHGDPGAVLDELRADPSVPLAEELICFLPPAFGLKENLRLLEDLATTFEAELT